MNVVVLCSEMAIIFLEKVVCFLPLWWAEVRRVVVENIVISSYVAMLHTVELEDG